MAHPTHTAVGTWSGGRFMGFGEPIDEARLASLLRPDGVRTVMSADVYGAGEADALLGRVLEGVPRDDYVLVGAVGHDFYTGERNGPRGYPRFTDPRLRGPDGYAGYLRMAAERSLERLGVDAFDLLLLHNPDRTGFESPRVWEALAELRDSGITELLGLAPGPANGFTLDVIRCLERYGELIDWVMLILNPLEPWPAELTLPACARHGARVIARVVDYGGLFWDDVLPGHEFRPGDHRRFRPEGWVDAGRRKLERMRPVAERHGLTPLQLACQWDLAHEPVACVAPTLIQEAGPDAKAIEAKRAELAAVPATSALAGDEVRELREIGDNTGSMLLKGATPDHEGEERPDRWAVSAELAELARRYGIEPERDLRRGAATAAA